MKRLIEIILSVVCLVSGCTKGFFPQDNYNGEYSSGSKPVLNEYTAIVTVKQESSGQVFLQLDDETRLYPTRYPEPFTRECRIICGLSWWSGSSSCNLQWMDYLQEGAVQDGPAREGDPVDILDDWMTSAEDGYLTLHYSTFWGYGSVPHTLKLITGENPEDPYEVRLEHQSNGDAALEKADALIYFDLSSLPPTGGSKRKLTLKWNGSDGESAKSFLYKSRQ